MKSSLKGFLVSIEAFLDSKSKRENVLLRILAFVIGFVLCFLWFGDLKIKLDEAHKNTQILEQRLLDFQYHSLSKENQDLKDRVEILTSKIATQEQEKAVLNGRNNWAFRVEHLARELGVEAFRVSLDLGKILVEGEGRFPSVFGLVEVLEGMSLVELEHFYVYPNDKNLEFFTRFKILEPREVE